ncbi:DUF721 domain-containing protein [Rhodophyticola porphyridii]|uniref:DUF721 domain-containing protein n=1 Tax=Rhodophyticola porphyridii TaxID=1852017 RepID=A0A3L9Y6E2_9RHOB|nr:DUF721 domain-containing protein [Rhodophyticola porphyridii]RMA42657.1 DUF721 domain-containing protein [Rhodophyticola porphyridii]
MSPETPTSSPRRGRGFQPASRLVAQQLRGPFEKRGFSEAKLLTHWAEIVGEETGRVAQPVKIRYGQRDGLGGTLVILTTGSHAPVLEMQKEQIRDRVNACYGYRAVARVQITQTAPTGFADGQVAFTAAPKPARAPSPQIDAAAKAAVEGVEAPELKAALERLARNIMTHSKS